MRILLVEDSPKMSAALQKGLGSLGYAVTATDSGREAEELASVEPFDLVLLDVMLPDRDGVEVCRNLRNRKVATPVMMLTALSSTKEKIIGLDAGADDYLAKPFEFSELDARIRALLRRGTATESAVLRHGDLELDLAKRMARRGDKMIRLTTKQFALLEYLMRNPDRVLTRQTIAEHVWDMNFDPFSNVIDVYISKLRKKLAVEEDAAPLIHTVIGAGYVFGENAPQMA